MTDKKCTKCGENVEEYMLSSDSGIPYSQFMDWNHGKKDLCLYCFAGK